MQLSLCGVDDNTNINEILKINQEFNFIEWCILINLEKEGTSRYPKQEFISKLFDNHNLKLVGHLCGSVVVNLLSNNLIPLTKYIDLGFRKFQINATIENGVKLDDINNYYNNLLHLLRTYDDIEWVIQRNFQTESMCQKLELEENLNISFLIDSSCGKGIFFFNKDDLNYECNYKLGYAGGINKNNVRHVLKNLSKEYSWIDMESGLRLEDKFQTKICLEIAKIVNQFNNDNL